MAYRSAEKIMDSGLQSYLNFLEAWISVRLLSEIKSEPVLFPKLNEYSNSSSLGKFIEKHELSDRDVVALLLALVPHIYPQFLNDMVLRFLPKGGEFVEFGGIKGKNHRGIIPTGETLVYLLAGTDLEGRIRSIDWIAHQGYLFQKGIISLGRVPENEPFLCGALLLAEDYFALLTLGLVSKPRLSLDFPARPLETGMEWEDLVLPLKTLSEIREIETWLNFNNQFLESWGMKSRVQPGYRVIFYGVPGTGKSLTAALLGKYTGRNVYRVDLSMVVSKYIGDTEKNLANLFNKASDKDWILFFDEGDALFGKRTNIKDAHDKHANQEVSYLLQRIESHSGLVILATNYKSNLDSAFTRRFQSIIAFEPPAYKERLQLWKNNLPEHIPLESGIVLEDIAKKYALTGANIINAIHYMGLKTVACKDTVLRENLMLSAIRKEYIKEGKSLDF